MTNTEEIIKRKLVTFFRDGTNGDYLDSLNQATNELTALINCECKDFAIENKLFVCKNCGRKHKLIEA